MVYGFWMGSVGADLPRINQIMLSSPLSYSANFCSKEHNRSRPVIKVPFPDSTWKLTQESPAGSCGHTLPHPLVATRPPHSSWYEKLEQGDILRGVELHRLTCISQHPQSESSAGWALSSALSFINSAAVVSFQPCPVALARLQWLLYLPGTRPSVQGNNTLALEDASLGWNLACSEGITTLKASNSVRSQIKNNSYMQHCPIRLHESHFFIGR